MENNLPNNVVFSPMNPQVTKLPSAVYNFDFDQKPGFHYYWEIIKKRKWIVLSFFLTIVTVVGIISFLTTPVYKSSMALQITQDNAAAMIGDKDLGSLFSSDSQGKFYETQYLILKSRAMAYKIMETLNLLDSDEFKTLIKSQPDKPIEEIKSKYANDLLSRLSVKPLKRSYLVEISFESEDKHLAQKVVNSLPSIYMNFCMETRRQSYDMVKNWLDGELLLLGSKVEESEKKLYEHGQKKDFLAIEGKDNTIVKKFIELSMLLTRAESERIVKEAQYKQIKAKGTDSPIITNNVLIQRLREEAISQETKISGMSKVFDENYPQMQTEKGKLRELNSRLNNEIKRLSTSIEADYQAAVRTENLLREAIETQKRKVGELQSNLVQHHILKRDMQANEQLYQALLARMKEASVSSTMVSSNVAVINPAEFPFKPYKPKKRLNVMLAAIVGLIGGIGLAFLIEYYDDTIKNTEEMERACHLPSLGVIPSVALAGRNHPGPKATDLVAFNDPKSGLTEAIRHVRTALMLSSAEGPPKVLTITSPNPNDGKSTFALNLAIALSMNERRTVLIDADLRRPSIYKVFQVQNAPGLSDFITGGATFNEIIYPTDIDNLSLIPAGTIPPDPTELLTSKVFEKLLLRLREEFNHVIIDTAPIIGFADARILSSSTDGVVLVIKQNHTSRVAGRLAMQLLTQVNAKVIGAVLNMATSYKLAYGLYSGIDDYSKYYNTK